MTKPKVICHRISKTYGQGDAAVQALQEVNLTIDAGEIRLLMGPSGSGKTTLISIIAGILSPTTGDCHVNDVNFAEMSDAKRTHYRGHHIGFVFQQFNLIPMLSNEENVAIPLLINNQISKKAALERAKHLLAEVGLKDKIGAFPPQLSGGQQQRVAIARALVHQPELIVCDEPTSFLDHESGAKIMTLLKEMVVKSKATLVIVTHDPRIMEFADKIDHLEDGRIVSTKTNGKV